MGKIIQKKVYYFIPVVVWMILIFTLSAQPKIVVVQESTLDFFIHKAAHVIEYAILCSLFIFAFTKSTGSKITVKLLLLAAILSIFYAATDEFHQTFVPTRGGRVEDVGIDSLGVTLAVAYTYLTKVKFTRIFGLKST